MQTTRGSSAVMASSMLAAARGGLDLRYWVRDVTYTGMGEAHGTKIAEAVAPTSLIASDTLAKTGLPRCVSPAFLGFVPPTTLVPWKV